MKIESFRPTAAPSSSTAAKSSGDSGFTLSPAQAGSAPAIKAASGVLAANAVLALQGADDVMQKRARQIRRGHDSLDSLDRLRLGLLEGQAPGDVRSSLARLLRDRDDAGDADLNAVLDQIDVRVAVELAKLERR